MKQDLQSSDGEDVAIVYFDIVSLWRVSDGQLVRTLTKSLNSGSVAFFPDGLYLVSAGGDTIRLWRVSDGQLLQTDDQETNLVQSVQFLPEGDFFAYGCLHGNVVLARNPFYTPPPDGDVNGDGCVDDVDLLQVLFAFGGQGSNADVNRDGVVDDADLLVVLFNFGAGC